MFKKYSKILILTIIVFSSCKNRNEEAVPMWSTNNSDITKWKEEALTKGDTNAYYNLSKDYMDSPYDGFLETAISMANKHEYHLAYSDAYDCLTNIDRKSGEHELKPLNESKRRLAIELLQKGAYRGNLECKHKLGELYLEGIYIEKDTIIGNLLIREGE